VAFRLIWSPSARLDLRDIAAFIAEDSSSVAERFIGTLFGVVERSSERTVTASAPAPQEID